MPDLVDLNEAFGKALLAQFFEPIMIGRGPDGGAYYAPAAASIMAQEIYKTHAHAILNEVWEKINIEDLAAKVAELVVADLIKTPGLYQHNAHQDKLKERVLEIVAQELGQRVVENLGVQIGPTTFPL